MYSVAPFRQRAINAFWTLPSLYCPRELPSCVLQRKTHHRSYNNRYLQLTASAIFAEISFFSECALQSLQRDFDDDTYCMRETCKRRKIRKSWRKSEEEKERKQNVSIRRCECDVYGAGVMRVNGMEIRDDEECANAHRSRRIGRSRLAQS